MIKRCIICNRKFEVKVGNQYGSQKTCSKECKIERQKILGKNRYKTKENK